MATDDRQILVAGQAPAPASWVIPGNGQIQPKTVYALFNGSSTTTPYKPALKIFSDGGELIGIYQTPTSVAAAGSANVSWFPGAELDQPSQSSGGVADVTSVLGTIAVSNPTGPTTNVDLPHSGVVAGSYGDASHSAEITVDIEGRVTSATQVGIAGGASTIGFEVGYDQNTSNVTITSTTEATGTTVISCAAHTFDGSPVIGEFFCAAGAIGPTGGANFTVCLFEGATEIGELAALEQPIGTGVGITAVMIGKIRFTPTAGSHTYTVTAFKSAAGATCTLIAGSGGTGAVVPMYMRFTKV